MVLESLKLQERWYLQQSIKKSIHGYLEQESNWDLEIYKG